MRRLGARLAWGLERAAWKLDANVVWPGVDAIQDPPSAYAEEAPASARRPWWYRHGADLLLAAALTVVAFLLRRHGLPTDGLWLDDSITGAGRTAAASDLFAVSADHPGFMVALMGLSDLSGGNDVSLTYPALVAGTLGPPLLFLALRWCGYQRSISTLLAAALAVAATDVVYSGRVRSFTIDLLVVLGLAMIVPRLTRIRWRWLTGLAWIAAAALLAFISGFALIAVGVAGGIVLLHPAADLRVRALAVGVSEAICIALLTIEGHTRNLSAQEDTFRRVWDAFPDFDPNPVSFGGEVFVHLRRVGEYFVGGPQWFAGACILVAIAALAVAAWRGREAVRARYLLLLLLVALIAGLLGKFPFGPSQGALTSSGGRVSLWLIPIVAIGLAAALVAVRAILGRSRVLGFAFDAAAYVAAAAIVVAGLGRDSVAYPFPGAESATEFVESQLGQHDALLIGYGSNWSFASESSFDSGGERTPHFSIGFQPDYSDPRIHYVNTQVDPAQIDGAVSQANRVFVYYVEHPFSPEAQLTTDLGSTLGLLGFDQQPTQIFEDASVQVWIRPGAGPILNLGPSDLPPGWRVVSPREAPGATHLLACLRVAPPDGADASVVTATGPDKLNVLSELNGWQNSGPPLKASAALGRPSGAACVRSTVSETLTSVGLPLKVTVKRERPPATAGPHAVAYQAIARLPSGGAPAIEGSTLFFSRGRTSALVLGFRGGPQPFPQALLAQLAKSLTHRMRPVDGRVRAE